jgi:hypothetical protein
MTTSLALSGGVIRSLTVGKYGYQAVTGARPLTKKPNVTSDHYGQATGKGDSHSARDMTGSASGRGHSSDHRPFVDKKYISATCASTVSVGPCSANKVGESDFRHIHWDTFNSSLLHLRKLRLKVLQCTDHSVLPRKSDSIKDAETSWIRLEFLHIHPFITSFGNDDLSVSTESPTDSPLEFFVDGPETDVASTNRSPSPIQYAILPDNSELSDWHSQMMKRRPMMILGV